MARYARNSSFAGMTYQTRQGSGGGGATGPTGPTGPTGGGTAIPTPPDAGLLLTSTGSGPGDFDWEPPGGFQISTFTGGSVRELGNSDVDPTFHATYNELPDSANIAYPAAGSPLVLITPFTSGQILQTFVSSVNGTTFTFTLSATKGSTTKTANSVDVFGYPFLFDVSLVGDIVATQGYLDTMRADHAPQVHTAFAGTYGPLTVGAGEQFAIAYPTALGTPTVFDNNGFSIVPTTIGVVAGYVNPFGVTISMTLITCGGEAIGPGTFFSLTP